MANEGCIAGNGEIQVYRNKAGNITLAQTDWTGGGDQVVTVCNNSVEDLVSLLRNVRDGGGGNDDPPDGPTWLPPALAKACVDQDFKYRLRLRDGLLVEFVGAEASPARREWVHLLGVTVIGSSQNPNDFGRGLDVRVRDVVWVADGNT